MHSLGVCDKLQLLKLPPRKRFSSSSSISPRRNQGIILSFFRRALRECGTISHLSLRLETLLENPPHLFIIICVISSDLHPNTSYTYRLGLFVFMTLIIMSDDERRNKLEWRKSRRIRRMEIVEVETMYGISIN